MYKQPHSTGNLYLGEKATFLEKDHATGWHFQLPLWGRGVSLLKTSWKWMLARMQKSQGMDPYHAFLTSFAILFLCGSILTCTLSDYLSGSAPLILEHLWGWLHTSVNIPRQTHHLHQAWFLCLKPQESSPSWYKGLCDAYLLLWNGQDFPFLLYICTKITRFLCRI